MPDGDSLADGCPPLTLRVELSCEGATDEAVLRALPAKPGILVLEDHAGRTLSVITTADLRRAATARLGSMPSTPTRSPRANLRGVARLALASTVGSSFEAEWAYLQVARARLPHSYRHMLDRWQAWFIQCDSDEHFPQWIKTSDPASGKPAGGITGVCAGPFADKHAAHRFIEMLEDAFDLCRYHHILVQAPHGSACAYKEMGRCPAPCDGSIAMSQYLAQVRESIDFARSPEAARQRWSEQMRIASAALDFETAQRCKTLIDRTAAAVKPKFRHVRDLDDFRIVAVLPGEREAWARIMFIDRGRIMPVADVNRAASDAELAEVIAVCDATTAEPSLLGDQAVENIGLACRHLLMPRAETRRRRAVFLHLSNGVDATALRRAMSSMFAGSAHEDAETVPEKDASMEQELEGT